MKLIFVIAACGIIAAIAAFAASTVGGPAKDPVDPSAAEHAVHQSIQHHAAIRRFLHKRLDRTTAGGYMLSVGFLIVFGAALLMGALLQLSHHSTWAQRVDRSVSEWGSTHATSEAVDAIKVVTQFGSTISVSVVLIVAAAFDFFRRRNKEVFLFVAAVGLGELALSNLLKVLVHRQRPLVLHLVSAHGYSFPSGHSTAAAAAWSAVALVLGRDRSRLTRSVLSALAALIAISVAASRALLGVHWVTDVLAGLAIGWGWFLLVAVVFGGRSQRLGEPAAAAVADQRPVRDHA